MKPTKPLPLNFLLGCSKHDLDSFELARLAEVSDLRKELHSIFDRVIDAMAQAALVAWFKEQDRQSLKRALESEESALEWAKGQIRNRGRSKEEIAAYKMRPPIPLALYPTGKAHLAAALRYQERQVSKGLCAICPLPLDRNSVRYCSKHLKQSRERAREAKKRKRGKP